MHQDGFINYIECITLMIQNAILISALFFFAFCAFLIYIYINMMSHRLGFLQGTCLKKHLFSKNEVDSQIQRTN